MPAEIIKPIDLKPIEALTANMSAPGMVTASAAQGSTNAVSGAATACHAVLSMWAPVSATVTEDGTTRDGLNAGGGRRIASIYQRKDEAVTTLVTTDDENGQRLTLLATQAVAE
jgi:hypothetical protein